METIDPSLERTLQRFAYPDFSSILKDFDAGVVNRAAFERGSFLIEFDRHGDGRVDITYRPLSGGDDYVMVSIRTSAKWSIVEQFSAESSSGIFAGRAVLDIFQLLPQGCEVYSTISETTLSGDSFGLYAHVCSKLLREDSLQIIDMSSRRMVHDWFVYNLQGRYSDMTYAQNRTQLLDFATATTERFDDLFLGRRPMFVPFDQISDYFPWLQKNYPWERCNILLTGKGECLLLPKVAVVKIIQ